MTQLYSGLYTNWLKNNNYIQAGISFEWEGVPDKFVANKPLTPSVLNATSSIQDTLKNADDLSAVKELRN